MTADEERKRAAGFAAVDRYVRTETCIGLGTGSTAHWAVVRVGERVAAGDRIVAVATSVATERQCRELGIPLVALGDREIDVAIDGADEVAADWSLTKGAGGALFREKAVALAAKTFVVVVTPEKLVERLGAFPTPVEVVPFALASVVSTIATTLPHVRVKQRKTDLVPFITDNGNVIIDCSLGPIADPEISDIVLRAIHGVVATGLFPAPLTKAVLVAYDDGVRELSRPSNVVPFQRGSDD
jgi:ribose 5-phosphate isomerase A